MADVKISALPASTLPLAGTEVLPIVQSSTTKQVSVANLTAGRAISATQLTLTTGNLIVASGQGIDFSATAGTGTSELLADYEEGTFTPTDASGAGLTLTVNNATYRKIGSLVYFTIDISYPVTANASAMLIGSLPFTIANDAGGSIGFTTFAPIEPNFVQISSSLNGVRIQANGGSTQANGTVSGKRFQISGSYVA